MNFFNKVSKILFLIGCLVVSSPLAHAMDGKDEPRGGLTRTAGSAAVTKSAVEREDSTLSAQAKKKKCCGGLCWQRSPERIVHNIRTESWRAVECAWNFLHCRGWHYNIRLEKMRQEAEKARTKNSA